MQFILDILLIAIFGLLVFRGFRRGFIRSILGLGRLILAFVITAVFGSKFSGWLDETLINPPIFELVNGKLTTLGEKANGSIENLHDSIPDFLSSHLGGEIGGVTGNIDATVDQWSHTIANGLSGAIATVLGTVLLFVLSFLVLTVVLLILSKIISKTIFNGPDKLLGLVMGAISGVIAVILLSKVLGALVTVFGQEQLIYDSIILKLFA